MNIFDLFPFLRGNKPAPANVGRTAQPNYTKAGPGRKHQQGRASDSKSTASLKAGAYGRGLRNHFHRLNAVKCAQRAAKRQDRAKSA